MELKDVILSTLAEMEEPLNVIEESLKEESTAEMKKHPAPKEREKAQEVLNDALKNYTVDNELFFLTSVRERLLVLFEGFQAPNNVSIEAKVDLTLNFLEYLLATIDNRVEILEKGNRK